ncbi:hypothetical protein [Dehalococcoides mccartyi]|uniref:hypothetical protein n=1 Tax=Dehalococcoides mccartyi TaxID=61435 RepID=UPI002430CDF7|nr:hypothetical protein [Dehalococcoides mccartyi]
MSKKIRGKIAPEDFEGVRCNWMECEGAWGLTGRGVCGLDGEWDNPKCPKFEKNKREEKAE